MMRCSSTTLSRIGRAALSSTPTAPIRFAGSTALRTLAREPLPAARTRHVPRVYGNHVKTVNITDLVGSFAEVSNDIELIDNTIEGLRNAVHRH